MSDINSCTLSGRLGRDSELKWLPSQTAILNFSIANNTGYGDKKTVTWYNCAIFGNFAESMEPYLKKGIEVTVVGEIRMNKWTGNDGVEKQSLQLKCDQCKTSRADDQGAYNTGSGQQSGAGGFRKHENPAPSTDPKQKPLTGNDFVDDDIPF